MSALTLNSNIAQVNTIADAMETLAALVSHAEDLAEQGERGERLNAVCRLRDEAATNVTRLARIPHGLMEPIDLIVAARGLVTARLAHRRKYLAIKRAERIMRELENVRVQASVDRELAMA